MSQRVAILGRLTRDKGFDVVVACARDAERRGLPLAFRVLGSTEAPLPPLPAGRISMTGEYPEGELSRLVAAESPDMMLFAAQWPETWSYTLTAALATGRPIVASSLGALGERLAGVPNATIVPWDAPAETWNDALLAALPRRADAPSAGTGGVDWPTYVKRLAAAWTPAPHADATMPLLDARHLEPLARGLAPARSRSSCAPERYAARRRRRPSSQSRAALADATLADIARERDESRKRIAALESSRSWKLTARAARRDDAPAGRARPHRGAAGGDAAAAAPVAHRDDDPGRSRDPLRSHAACATSWAAAATWRRACVARGRPRPRLRRSRSASPSVRARRS
jgi:hypothetical protein